MPLNAADIRMLAEGYTQAWRSRSGRAVASFFAEDATSFVNGAVPTIGRSSIATEMGTYFQNFPDLVLHMDELRCGGNQAIFLWTLEGTNSGPGGTGNFVRISGWQNWRLSEDLLIVAAEGGYDAAEYERQIRESI